MRVGIEPPRVRLRLLVCAALIGSVACDGVDPGRARSSPQPSTSTSPIVDRTAGVEGVIYVLAGPNGFDLDLYRLELDPLRVSRVTTERRVSSIDGCATALFVSAPATLGDALFRLEADELKPLPGLGKSHASAPAASFDCSRVAYSRNPDGNFRRSFSIRVWDVERAELDHAISGRKPLGDAIWGPRDSVTLITRGGDSFVTDGEDRREIALPLRTATAKWSPGGTLAVSTRDLEVFVSNGSERFERVAQGWVVQDWSPNGRSLLLRRADRPTLGLYRPGSDRVRVIARLGLATLFAAEWISPQDPV